MYDLVEAIIWYILNCPSKFKLHWVIDNMCKCVFVLIQYNTTETQKYVNVLWK